MSASILQNPQFMQGLQTYLPQILQAMGIQIPQGGGQTISPTPGVPGVSTNPPISGGGPVQVGGSPQGQIPGGGYAPTPGQPQSFGSNAPPTPGPGGQVFAAANAPAQMADQSMFQNGQLINRVGANGPGSNLNFLGSALGLSNYGTGPSA